MAFTQTDIAGQMLAQLRILDPSISAEVGTPERLIIDTLAQALSDAEIDLTILQGGLDMNSKVGANLDKFLALFGFARQAPTRAIGFVTLGRTDPSLQDIRIPVNTQVQARGSFNDEIFLTQFDATLPAGNLSILVPIIATVPGSAGNVPANTINQFVGQPVYGITSVTNDQPTVNGNDEETDDELKVRFGNTVFRNLAGTQDQYLALAATTQKTTKANVVGAVSRYREYLQVPGADDTVSYNVNPQTTGAGSLPDSPGTGGIPGEYTTALSTVPYSKHTYSTIPAFVSNGDAGVNTIFYRNGIDWRMNTTPGAKNFGDTYRYAHSDVPLINEPGYDPLVNPAATNQPNVTFTNVYTGPINPLIQQPRPGDLVLFEHSYLSQASRNDTDRNIYNCVDVFIDGENILFASMAIPAPGPTVSAQAFNAIPTSPYYYLNYRRNSRPDPSAVPQLGNLFIPLYFQPALEIPPTITITGLTSDGSARTATFFQNIHYFFVEDITELRGTIRARNGIEFNPNLISIDSNDIASIGISLGQFLPSETLTISNYSYDQNVVDIQASIQSNKQITTDVLVHRAKTRHFKFDISVMYSQGQNTDAINLGIQAAVSTYLSGLYYGDVIQLSDVLQVIHEVSGVDNVRWSSDIPGATDTAGVPYKIYETDAFGIPVPVPSATFTLAPSLLNISAQTTGGSSLAPATNYYYTVTAVGPNGESFVSNELSVQTAPALNPPIQGNPPTQTAGGTLPAGTYFYVVTALGPGGETNGSAEQTITTTSAGSVTVTWNGVVGATGYRVYRGSTTGAENTYWYVPPTATTYLDNGTAGTSRSVPLANTTGTTSSVVLNWTPVTGALSYNVYRGTQATLENIKYSLGNQTTFTDTGGLSYGAPPAATSSTLTAPSQSAIVTSSTLGALPAATYFYVVTALDVNGGETIGSNERSITTTGAASTNTISWSSVTGATAYRIYRGTAAGAENVFYTVGTATTSFVDSGQLGTLQNLPAANGINTDFFLKDDELPALPDVTAGLDTVPGFRIRPRAQNTWLASNQVAPLRLNPPA